MLLLGVVDGDSAPDTTTKGVVAGGYFIFLIFPKKQSICYTNRNYL